MRLFYGTVDTIVLPSTVTALAASAGANTAISSGPGDHGSATFASIDPATILAFVQANWS